jgi:GAF domain-containing protein
MTGQPISVRDVRQDARFNQDFASSTGYVPRSILATPLLVGDRVIGVMEVLDKINAPSFGMQDMDLLGLFAHQAAIAIHQAQQYDRLGEALIGGLRRLVSPGESPGLSGALDSAHERALDGNLLAVADELNALSQMGEGAQRLCLDVLRAFGSYSRARTVLY